MRFNDNADKKNHKNRNYGQSEIIDWVKFNGEVNPEPGRRRL